MDPQFDYRVIHTGEYEELGPVRLTVEVTTRENALRLRQVMLEDSEGLDMEVSVEHYDRDQHQWTPLDGGEA